MNIYAMKAPSKVNPTSVSLFFVLLGLGYCCWALAPIMWPLWQVSSRMRTACVAAYQETDDRVVIEDLLKSVRHLGLKLSADNFRMTRVAYEPAELENESPAKQQQLGSIGKECVVEFYYDDKYTWPFFGAELRWPYSSTARMSLERLEAKANWLNDFAYNSCTCTSIRRLSEAEEEH
ncbi:MAG: hypothetical protein KTR25_15145 [Myxococcales bacterium]|nr:hypothetical protein [Myxococcales bacterium]